MTHSAQRIAVAIAAATLVTTAASCSASKGSADGNPTTPTVQTAKVRTTDVITGAPIAGATISGSGVTGGATDSAGNLTVMTSSAATFGIDVANPSYILRNTLLKVPGGDAGVSLIPNALNLLAFNQMLRNGATDGGFVDGPLRRWTTQPSLAIVTSVVQYTPSGTIYTASAERLSDAEVLSIRNDLSSGVLPLTGGVFQNFSAISNLPAAAGEGIQMMVEGRITFARCTGLSAAGLGTWQFRDDVVNGGLICVDRDFELAGSNQIRAVRLHELGHALGYHHVPQDVKDHVLMNPAVSVTDITEWDRQAAVIAFQRPAGNRTPDKDPATFSTNSLVTRAMTIGGCKIR